MSLFMFARALSKLTLAVAVASAVIVLGACTGADEPATPTTATGERAGTLEVRVTDAPDPDVSSVFVTVEGVEVHRADPGEWRRVVEGPVTFDLVALTGVEAVLGSEPLEAGRYTQVRLDVNSVDVTRSGVTAEAEVPSGTLKLVGTFVLEPDETTIITLDFDLEKSLVQRGGQTPLFKPVVKLLVGEPGTPGQPTVPLTGAPATPVPSPTATKTPRPTPTAAPTATTAPAPTPEAAGPDGTLEVRVTDAPDEDVSSVLVTVDSVEVHRADPGEWRSVVEGPVTFDLVALTGVEAVLGSEPLEAGRYTQVRLEVDSVDVTLAGVTAEAEVPSGTLKLVGTFALEPAETTIITLDFDLETSLVQRGGKSPLFRPVVKLLVGEPDAPGQPTVPLTGAPATPVPSPAATEIPAPAPTETPEATTTPTPAPTQPVPTPTQTPEPTPTQDPTGELFLAIEEPADLVDVATEGTYDIVGRTRLDALVSVNDQVVDVDEDGRFTATVELAEGDNVIEVVASIASGEEVGESIVIFYEVSGG